MPTRTLDGAADMVVEDLWRGSGVLEEKAWDGRRRGFEKELGLPTAKAGRLVVGDILRDGWGTQCNGIECNGIETGAATGVRCRVVDGRERGGWLGVSGSYVQVTSRLYA